MITVTDLSLHYGSDKLFSHANLLFTVGNCYGIIGANGAGKSTFLKILSGELESTSGSVHYSPKLRMSVLKQDQNKYDDFSVMETVLMGNARLYEIMKEKDALYAKEDFSDADGIRASELEGEFAEMGGWEAESEASRVLQGLGISTDLYEQNMSTLDGRQKVKVLLAQALFGQPDMILLDEPTNNLDYQSIEWLEDFLADFPGTAIIVSHDRHFLNAVCTHIVDIDYSEIKMYVGNYDFWYESSQLIQQMLKDQNRKAEEKAKELQDFINRFSANKSKARQATSRKKLLEGLSINELPASSRRYPWVGFSPDREAGKDILEVEDLTKTVDGVLVLDHISFTMGR
ncbi:MAG: ATP-binding cassette domain-containing protein, partial [Clostridiales Family XIII bacterium]|nr:ATP-binding cassette domain-containing protein [Clostridiales Family XIII bacterium]